MTTRRTTAYRRGDIVLVPFQFTDQPLTKRRPALVISSSPYHRGRSEVIIAALTSRIRTPLLVGDHLIQSWQRAGLPKASVATSILRTVKGGMVLRRIGSLAAGDMAEIDRHLRKVLAL